MGFESLLKLRSISFCEEGDLLMHGVLCTSSGRMCRIRVERKGEVYFSVDGKYDWVERRDRIQIVRFLLEALDKLFSRYPERTFYALPYAGDGQFNYRVKVFKKQRYYKSTLYYQGRVILLLSV